MFCKIADFTTSVSTFSNETNVFLGSIWLELGEVLLPVRSIKYEMPFLVQYETEVTIICIFFSTNKHKIDNSPSHYRIKWMILP